MIKTSERLKKGADLYYQRFFANINEEKRQFPTINYPDKVDKYYFNRLDSLGGTKIEVVFLQRTFYKKVEGYRQVNYQKHRILSNTMYKDKFVSIKFDVTPTALNNLRHHTENYVSKNALGIISATKNVTWYPAWAQTEFLDLVHKKTLETINNDAKTKRNMSDSAIKKQESLKCDKFSTIANVIKLEKALKAKISKTIIKSIEAGFAKHKVFKTIFTLGIYDLNRIHKHAKMKAEKLQVRLDHSIVRKESLIKESHEIEDGLVILKNLRSELEADIEQLLKIEDQQYALDKSNISQAFSEVLDENVISRIVAQQSQPNYTYHNEVFNIKSENLQGFVNVKDEKIDKLKGLDVIGAYAIRNIETGTIYMGISFDVEKSMATLFSNDAPLNPIMRKEYQRSNRENKTSLFEVKVAIAKTKSELLEQYTKLEQAYCGKFVHN